MASTVDQGGNAAAPRALEASAALNVTPVSLKPPSGALLLGRVRPLAARACSATTCVRAGLGGRVLAAARRVLPSSAHAAACSPSTTLQRADENQGDDAEAAFPALAAATPVHTPRLRASACVTPPRAPPPAVAPCARCAAATRGGLRFWPADTTAG